MKKNLECYVALSYQDDKNCKDFSGKFNLRIPKSLHKKLAESAKADGVSLNQMALYLIASGLGERE